MEPAQSSLACAHDDQADSKAAVECVEFIGGQSTVFKYDEGLLRRFFVKEAMRRQMQDLRALALLYEASSRRLGVEPRFDGKQLRNHLCLSDRPRQVIHLQTVDPSSIKGAY